jgi:hypothetical protein
MFSKMALLHSVSWLIERTDEVGIRAMKIKTNEKIRR